MSAPTVTLTVGADSFPHEPRSSASNPKDASILRRMSMFDEAAD
jgi:hypothetical protein